MPGDIEIDVGLQARMDELTRLADEAQQAVERGLGRVDPRAFDRLADQFADRLVATLTRRLSGMGDPLTRRTAPGAMQRDAVRQAVRQEVATGQAQAAVDRLRQADPRAVGNAFRAAAGLPPAGPPQRGGRTRGQPAATRPEPQRAAPRPAAPPPVSPSEDLASVAARLAAATRGTPPPPVSPLTLGAPPRPPQGPQIPIDTPRPPRLQIDAPTAGAAADAAVV